MNSPIKKAVFPVAGLGTRFLPATKANPKEMLPIVDKPLIQYAAEEAISAGITELIFVTSSAKRAIEDHFDSQFGLESMLAERGKYDLLTQVRNIIPDGITCIYVRQAEPRGLGHAILCAKEIVGDDPFAVLLADDLIESHGGINCMQRMVNAFSQHQQSVIAVDSVDMQDIHKYGVVALSDDPNQPTKVTHMVEKPQSANAPSNLAAVGRYILTPAIFKSLQSINPGAGGELQLTDAIRHMLDKENLYIHRLKGKRYDCGDRLGYLQATINYALQHPLVGHAFHEYLLQFSQQLVANEINN